MNRAQLKAQIRENMRAARPSPYLVTLLFVLPGIIFGGIISGVTAFGSGFFDIAGNYVPGAIVNALGLGTSISVGLLALAFCLMYYLVSVGYIGYCLRVARGQEVGVGNLFDYINRPLRFLGLAVLLGLVSACISVAGNLLGPIGAIAAMAVSIYVNLGFSMSVFVAIDRPELGIIGCMRESWQMMRGRRWEYFVLGLSFFGWALLCIFIFPMFFVYPYMESTLAGYYSLISGWQPEGAPEPFEE